MDTPDLDRKPENYGELLSNPTYLRHWIEKAEPYVEKLRVAWYATMPERTAATLRAQREQTERENRERMKLELPGRRPRWMGSLT